jgi:lipopolysaccharide export LptBFGC system permease protein LptF
MGTLPDQFRGDYENYGDSFFDVARLLVENHDRQFTQPDLADRVGVSQSRVSDFTATLCDDEWITRQENQTTFEWDTERYNPAEREATDAVFGLYRDLWTVLQAHSQTSTTLWSIFGLAFFVAATVLLAFYFAVSTGLFGESAVSPVVYLFLGGGLFISGLLMTALTPLQAFVNRFFERLIGNLGSE